MGGDGGDGGVGAASAAQKAEEDRRTALRTQINQAFGISAPSYGPPSKDQFTMPGAPTLQEGYAPDSGSFSFMGQGTPVFDQSAYDKAMADYSASGGVDPTAKAAQDAENTAETKLTDATRGYYQDQLQHDSERAFRNNRFALADRGLLGGSAQIDTERELSRDNTLGATRIGDQVTSAVNSLRNSNEQERLNAINLVNAGDGPDAVQSAQAGLQRSLENANNQQKVNITSDLFAGGADQVAAANQAYNPLLLAQLQGKLGSFFAPGAGSARVTPT